MMGRKTLAEVRAELEAALVGSALEAVENDSDAPTPAQCEIIESLRQFLANGSTNQNGANQPDRTPDTLETPRAPAS